ncbi:MAG: hypothetical protein ABR527_06720 [Gemmatimonadota bacterium]
MTGVQHFMIYVAVAILSIGIAQLGGSPFFSGISYGLLGPATALHGRRRRRRRDVQLGA